jgi:hypothetical protein
VVVAVCVAGGLTAYLSRESDLPHSQAGRAASTLAHTSTVTHPIYPYSVIPGGSYTAEELSRAVSQDAVTRAHYRGFDVGRARPELLPQDRSAYVSFRLRDRVYWTRRPMRLKRGETVLTDGASFARARCGNRIADTPQAPTSAEEPPPYVWNMPGPPAFTGVPRHHDYIPVVPRPELPQPQLPPPDWSSLPPDLFTRLADGLPPYTIIEESRPPILVTPKPSPLVLLTLALLAIAGLRFRHHRGGTRRP